MLVTTTCIHTYEDMEATESDTPHTILENQDCFPQTVSHNISPGTTRKKSGEKILVEPQVNK